MPASLADSPIYARLFGDAQAGALFSPSAEVRAMLLVEGALARVQGAAGIIPADAAAFIDRASREVQIDPAALGDETAQNGVPVPALLAAFRKAAGAPDMMQYLHWGATSQDIMDTAQSLRLRRLMDIWQARIETLLAALAHLARDHAVTPMAARTYGQYATPTSFGAVVAGWGWGISGWRDDLPRLRSAVELVSLSGAAGTGAALGQGGGQGGSALRAALAAALDLHDPQRTWHSDRGGIARLAGFAAGLAASLGKMAEDLHAMAQSGVEEIGFNGGGGGSSTMPQKQNPVGAAALAALCRHVIAQADMLQSAGIHRQQRDGAAWFVQWLALPPMCISLSRALSLAGELAGQITPNLAAMSRPLTTGAGLIYAESLSFALAKTMPRPQAAALVKDWCTRAPRLGLHLLDLAAQHDPATDWHAAIRADALGCAPDEARAFADHIMGA
jgi:3-carboxy-cis,cis-muconate cycloisomerase